MLQLKTLTRCGYSNARQYFDNYYFLLLYYTMYWIRYYNLIIAIDCTLLYKPFCQLVLKMIKNLLRFLLIICSSWKSSHPISLKFQSFLSLDQLSELSGGGATSLCSINVKSKRGTIFSYFTAITPLSGFVTIEKMKLVALLSTQVIISHEI